MTNHIVNIRQSYKYNYPAFKGETAGSDSDYCTVSLTQPPDTVELSTKTKTKKSGLSNGAKWGIGAAVTIAIGVLAYILTKGKAKPKVKPNEVSNVNTNIQEILGDLFKKHNIDPNTYDSFYHLCNAIEKDTFENLEKGILQKIKTPEEFVKYVENAVNKTKYTIKNKDMFNIDSNNLDKKILKDLLEFEKNSNTTSSKQTLLERLEKMINSYYEKGTEYIRVKYGYKCQKIEEAMSETEKQKIFDKIIDNLRKKYKE